MSTFEMNGKTYQADRETLILLRRIIPDAKKAHDYSAVAAVMTLGLHTGRITQLEKQPKEEEKCG